MSTKLSLPEIEKQLAKEELAKDLKKSLLEKKDILTNGKTVKK
jgi:hypothetical protein